MSGATSALALLQLEHSASDGGDKFNAQLRTVTATTITYKIVNMTNGDNSGFHDTGTAVTALIWKP